jgi:hypothetical protein
MNSLVTGGSFQESHAHIPITTLSVWLIGEIMGRRG